jgi:hypothetical protein
MADLVWKALMSALVIALVGCSASFEVARPGARQIVSPPAGSTAVIEPNGEEIIQTAPIETVLTGLAQAQQTRTLVRQLAR